MAGLPLMSIMRKLQRLKHELKVWDTQIFGNMDIKIRKLEKEFEEAMTMCDDNIEDEESVKALNKKELELIESIVNCNSLHKEKFRLAWIKDGERNSKFLHAMHKASINKALILELSMDDGRILRDQSTIRDALTDTFKQRF